jgi:hypothetical protein
MGSELLKAPQIRRPFIAAIVLVCVGLLFGILAGIWTPVFNAILKQQIHKSVALSGPKGEAWQYWVTTNFKDAPIIYETYGFYNCTNYLDVLQGSVPIVKEIGPFVYKYTKNKVNPTFNADKSELSYTRWVYWELIPELSIGDPNDFKITTLNPPYLGALHHAGNELLLPVGYSAVIVRELLEFIQTTYWKDTQTWYGTSGVSQVSAKQEAEYAQKHGVSATEAHWWFLDHWANSTVKTGNEALDGLSLPLAFDPTGPNPPTPSLISRASAQLLFDSSVADSFTSPSASFFNNSFASWQNATWDVALRQDLATRFSLDAVQMTMVLAWLQSPALANGVVIPQLQEQYNVHSLQEMACAAFGQTNFGIAQSVATLYPSLYPNGPVEYGFWQQYHSSFVVATLTQQQCAKMFFSPPKDLTQALVLGDFLPQIAAVLLSENFTVISEQWGITTRFQILAMTNYYVQTALNLNPISVTYSIPAINYWKQHGSGLFATRTVAEWLWNYTDPFAIRMLPDAPPMSFRHNLSTPEFAMAHTRPWTVNTGVKDPSQLQNTIVWDGYEFVPFYGAPLKVNGATEDGQYPSFSECKPSTRLATWIDDYAKNIPLACIDDSSKVLDLKTYTYTPDNTTWLVTPEVENFVAGFSNLSAKYNDSPVFLSNPHFFGAPEYYPKRVLGDASQQDLLRDQTLVYIEPYTGKVAKFRKGLQANLYIDANTTWFTGSSYANMYRDVMFPVMVGYVHAEVPPGLTKLVTGTVYLALKLHTVLFWILIGLTILMFLVAFIPAIIYWRRRNRFRDGGYSVIQ